MPPTETPLIEADGLFMHYAIGARQVPVLRGVDLRIGAGTRVAIAGPSGSGKTSLLLLLSGLEQPAAGRIRIAGTDLAEMDADGRADLRRGHIGRSSRPRPCRTMHWPGCRKGPPCRV